uniref:Uncharacterized protein n=1 Tax=Solanum lycopersicum TaxID=4081 RepID=A0A3Q7I2X3_SOLLC
MTIDEIVDAILGAKSGYIKGLGYGPKPDTTRATQRKRPTEVVVENQQSQITTLNSQLEVVLAREDDILKQVQQFMSSSPSRQSFVQKVCKDDEKLEIHGRNDLIWELMTSMMSVTVRSLDEIKVPPLLVVKILLKHSLGKRQLDFAHVKKSSEVYE